MITATGNGSSLSGAAARRTAPDRRRSGRPASAAAGAAGSRRPERRRPNQAARTPRHEHACRRGGCAGRATVIEPTIPRRATAYHRVMLAGELARGRATLAAGHPADAARAGARAAGRGAAVGQARRPHRPRCRRQQGPQAGVPVRRGAAATAPARWSPSAPAQSNHCRMTAAAGAVLGLEVHLVLSGDRPRRPTGQPAARRAVRRPAALRRLPAAPLGRAGDRPREAHRRAGRRRAPRRTRSRSAAARRSARSATSSATSSSSSSAGHSASCRRPSCTHRRAAARTPGWWPAGRCCDRSGTTTCPTCWRSASPRASTPASRTSRSSPGDAGAARRRRRGVVDDDVEIDTRWLGPDYGVPTAAGDEAIRWAAVHGGWVLDRTYSGKGFAGLLGNAATGRWRPGAEVVFLHTGGLPAVFAADACARHRARRAQGTARAARDAPVSGHRGQPSAAPSARQIGGPQEGAERRVPVGRVAWPLR